MGEELIIGGMPFYFNATDVDGNTARRSMGVHSPYRDYPAGNAITRNVDFPEIIITPDSKKDPATRAITERKRRAYYDSQYGRGAYDGMRALESPEISINRRQREWNNSTKKKALDYAAAAASGAGVGFDILSGLPIYSTLRGSADMMRSQNWLDRANAALWFTPYVKPVVGGVKAGVANAANWVNNQREIKALSNNIVQGMPFDKPWRDGSGKSNVAREFYFENKPDQRFQLVNDMEPGNYSIHFKTDQGALTNNEKAALFKRIANEIPYGGKISTWGEITPGGVHGVNRFGSDFGWKLIGTRDLKMKGSGDQVELGVFLKPEQSKVSKFAQRIGDAFNTGRFGYVRHDFPNQEFLSQLNWDPKDWFGRYRPGGLFDALDVAALESHVPEYHQIERVAKANGTWMKDESGNMMRMDPREWVIRQSRDYKLANLTGRKHYNGVSGKNALNHQYDGDAWTDLEKNISQTFKDQHGLVDGEPGYLPELDYPKTARKITFDADGHVWYDLPENNFRKYPGRAEASADEAVNQSKNQGYDVTQFNNIVEGNHNKVTDVVIHAGTPRKSILGNNGDFDLSNKNIYKSLIPASPIAPWAFANDN